MCFYTEPRARLLLTFLMFFYFKWLGFSQNSNALTKSGAMDHMCIQFSLLLRSWRYVGTQFVRNMISWAFMLFPDNTFQLQIFKSAGDGLLFPDFWEAKFERGLNKCQRVILSGES